MATKPRRLWQTDTYGKPRGKPCDQSHLWTEDDFKGKTLAKRRRRRKR
jgi:hypothetical protein